MLYKYYKLDILSSEKKVGINDLKFIQRLNPIIVGILRQVA